MTGTVELALGIFALVAGAVSEFESNGRNWAGWGVVALALIVVLSTLR